MVAGSRNPLGPCPHCYKVWRNLSVGPEAGLNLDRQANQKIYEKELNYHTQPVDYGRVGAFARIDWHGGELLVSSGLIGNFRKEKLAYGTINWIKHF